MSQDSDYKTSTVEMAENTRTWDGFIRFAKVGSVLTLAAVLSLVAIYGLHFSFVPALITSFVLMGVAGWLTGVTTVQMVVSFILLFFVTLGASIFPW